MDIPLKCFNHMGKLRVNAPNEALLPAIIDVLVRAGFKISQHKLDSRSEPENPEPRSFSSCSTLEFEKPGARAFWFVMYYANDSSFQLHFGLRKYGEEDNFAWVEYKGGSKRYWKGDFREVYRPDPDFDQLYQAFNYLNTKALELN